jgi:hypothetical protein
MNETKVKAVKMVRSIREAHHERIKDLSPKEKIVFFREKARADLQEVKSMLAKRVKEWSCRRFHIGEARDRAVVRY